MVAEQLGGLGVDVGTGAAFGFVSGILAKKVTKLVALLVGGVLLVAKWLESQGMMTMNWQSVGSGFVDIGSTAADVAPSLLEKVASTLGLGGGFVAGFYLGFRRG